MQQTYVYLCLGLVHVCTVISFVVVVVVNNNLLWNGERNIEKREVSVLVETGGGIICLFVCLLCYYTHTSVKRGERQSVCMDMCVNLRGERQKRDERGKAHSTNTMHHVVVGPRRFLFYFFLRNKRKEEKE